MGLDTVIKFEKASVVQNNQVTVLSDINLEIEKGEFVYLIGRTGSGKSSLLKVLYGDLAIIGQVAKIGDFDLTSIKTKDIPYLRRSLGIVFQDFQLLTDRTVGENLIFVMEATGWKNKTEMQQKVKDVLAKVGLENKVHKYPFELSGGEQQRIVIARALVNDPEVILADEPTGNLDPDTSNEILQLLKDISKSGRTILMATHDQVLIDKNPSRTLVCEGGRIIEKTAGVKTESNFQNTVE